jgi:hypothetical protein
LWTFRIPHSQFHIRNSSPPRPFGSQSFKHLWLVLALCSWVLAALCPCAFAQEENDEDEDELWGSPRIHAAASIGFSWTLPTVTDERDIRFDDGNAVNGFLRGASVSLRADVARRTDIRISFGAAPRSEYDLDQDGANDDPNAGEIVTSLSAAYVTWYAGPWLRVRGGLLPLPWSSLTNKVWGYSFAASSPSRRYGLTSTYDLGVSVFGDLPLALGSYALAVVNGEESRRPEQNRYKAGHAVLSVRPLPFWIFKRVGLSGCAIDEKRDDPPGDAIDRRRAFAALLSIPVSYVRLAAEAGYNLHYESTDKDPRQEGIYSVYATAKPRWDLGLFIRGDFRDPDLSEKHGTESVFSSRIRDRTLYADADRRYDYFAGAYYNLRRSVSVGSFGHMRFYEEYDNGNPIPPTADLNIVLTLRF